MTTIHDEFQKLITDVFSDANGKCTLTHKKRKAYEKLYFTAYRSCLTFVMLSSDMLEADAAKAYDTKVGELDSFFKALEEMK